MNFTISPRDSFYLLLISSIGVIFSGPLILGWIHSPIGPFWSFGEPWTSIGGYLDLFGGLFQIIMIYFMRKAGIFTEHANMDLIRKYYAYMAGICIIGLIADPLGGLLAIAAQLGFYTSIYNVYKSRK